MDNHQPLIYFLNLSCCRGQSLPCPSDTSCYSRSLDLSEGCLTEDLTFSQALHLWCTQSQTQSTTEPTAFSSSSALLFCTFWGTRQICISPTAFILRHLNSLLLLTTGSPAFQASIMLKGQFNTIYTLLIWVLQLHNQNLHQTPIDGFKNITTKT